MPQLVLMNLFEQMKALRTLLTPGKTKGNKQVLIEVKAQDKTIWWGKLHFQQASASACCSCCREE